MASQRPSLFLLGGGNECTSFCSSYHHPASWGLVFSSSSVCFLLLFIYFFLNLSCSEQSAARLLIRAVGQFLGIAAVCSALCSLRVTYIEEKGALCICLTIAMPLSWEWGCSCRGEWGGSSLQRSPHPVGKMLLPFPKFHRFVSGTIWEKKKPWLIAPGDQAALHQLSGGHFPYQV